MLPRLKGKMVKPPLFENGLFDKIQYFENGPGPFKNIESSQGPISNGEFVCNIY